MPDSEGKLSPDEVLMIQHWMTEKQATTPCPLCGNRTWAISDRLVFTPLYGARTVLLGGGFPAVLIFCNRCAFMRWHSAVAIGLVPGEESPATKQEAKHGNAS